MCTSHSRPKNQPSKQTKRLRAGHAGEISVRPRPAGRGGLLRADALECALTLLREADNRMLSASAGALSAPTNKKKRGRTGGGTPRRPSPKGNTNADWCFPDPPASQEWSDATPLLHDPNSCLC